MSNIHELWSQTHVEAQLPTVQQQVSFKRDLLPFL